MRPSWVYLYTGLYFIYLFQFPRLETEQMHWITLVILPFGLVILLNRENNLPSPRKALAFVHLSKNLQKGIGIAVLIGLTLGSLQIFLSRDSVALREILMTPAGGVKWLKAVGLMLITAGFTEEFFFRGVLLSALHHHTRSNAWSIGISALCFGLFHVPYAFAKHPPETGATLAAFFEIVTFPWLFGSFLGYLTLRYRNLLVPILIHSLFNSFWAIQLF